MLLVLALLMILSFILLLSKNKLSIIGALSLVPLFFGLLVVLLTGATFSDLFQWITDALFYKINSSDGSVSMGVISPGLLILFAVMYFDLMLNVGLFDPLCEFFIKKAKGDPLKVTLATVLTATVVTMNGDTTTTIIICVAAFLELYKFLNMKLSYLAILIVGPIGIFNQLPWGGPTIAASTAMNVPINELFKALIPGLLAAEIFMLFVAYRLGKKERKRLGFCDGADSAVDDLMTEKMLSSIREKDPDLKRPKLFWFNFLLTMGLLYLLIQGVAHGAVLFMIGNAIVLTVNYRKVDLINERIDEIACDALAPALATFAAGVFSGVLSGSGMATALAEGMTMIIPDELGAHMAPIYAVISAPAITFLPQDAFYFGIAKVVATVMERYGITALQSAVASMVGQAFRLISPVIPALFMLTASTEMNFVDFQKKYIKYCWPIIVIYIVVYALTGALPV
ncbi:citrate transporter [Erwinia sp. CPCC 100877]|nr:citrate transporter [Erwinia sp. CPCC 100877]